jgi:hypothetical protein
MHIKRTPFEKPPAQVPSATPAGAVSQAFVPFLITRPKVHKYHLAWFSQIIENGESHKPIWPNGMWNVTAADLADFGPIVHKSLFRGMLRGHLGALNGRSGFSSLTAQVTLHRR